MINEMRARLAAIAEQVSAVPREQRVRVYWEVFDQPLMSAGPRSVVGQLIELGGGVNVFADVAEEYPQINAEAVVARDPQVIMGPASMRAKSMNLTQLAARPGWASIRAIRDGRLFVLPDEPFMRAGPRLVEGVEMMARVLYPDRFPSIRGASAPTPLGPSHGR